MRILIAEDHTNSHLHLISQLQERGHQCLSTPLDIQPLVLTEPTAPDLLITNVQQPNPSQTMTSGHLTIQIGNRIESTTKIARLLVSLFPKHFSEKVRLEMTLGLDELLINAIEHGNLEINQQQKEQALYLPDGLHALYRQQLSKPTIASRTVSIAIDYELNKYCRWTITDQGHGFNWNEIPNPLQADALCKPSGRGIFLSRMIFDSVNY